MLRAADVRPSRRSLLQAVAPPPAAFPDRPAGGKRASTHDRRSASKFGRHSDAPCGAGQHVQQVINASDEMDLTSLLNSESLTDFLMSLVTSSSSSSPTTTTTTTTTTAASPTADGWLMSYEYDGATSQHAPQRDIAGVNHPDVSLQQLMTEFEAGCSR